MNLREYLFYSHMTIRVFAKLADLSVPCISGCVNNNYKPSAKTLRAIERATNGKVNADTIFAPTKLPAGWDENEGGKAA